MQTSVGNFDLGFGRTGEFYGSNNQHSMDRILNSANAALNIIGVVVKHQTADERTVGVAGNGNFAGILGIPKNVVRSGLANTTTVPNGQQVEVIDRGYVIVAAAGAANQGDYVYYNNTTGVLATAAPTATAPAGHTRVPGGKVYACNPTAAGQMVIELDSTGSTETPS